MLREEGRQFRCISFDALVRFPDEGIVHQVGFVEPVNVLFSQPAEFFQVILDLREVALHQSVVGIGSLIEAGEHPRVPADECSATQPFQSQVVACKAKFIKIPFPGLVEVGEVHLNVNIVKVDLEIAGGPFIFS